MILIIQINVNDKTQAETLLSKLKSKYPTIQLTATVIQDEKIDYENIEPIE